MKKKMLFMAAIAGLVTLGSCVKDDVSASVEAVRNAKANELNALANEHNANAAYTTAITAADVAFRQAQVAHEQADAKAQELLNENQAMANQMRAANLEAEIAADLADYEAATALAKQQVQQRMNALETAMRAAATNKATDIMNAVTAYNTAYGKYLGAQKNVIAAQIRLETAKNDAENAKAIAETTMKSFDSQIAAQKELIAQLEEVSSTGMTAAEAEAAVKVLNAKINKATTEFNNSDEVKALIEAGQELAKATLALAATEAFTFGTANDMVREAFWIDTDVPADGIVDTPNPLYAWWPSTGGVPDDYFYSSGTTDLDADDINFYDMTKYQIEFTADNWGLDVNGNLAPVGSQYDPNDPAVINPHDTTVPPGNLVVGDGINDETPDAVARGQQLLNGVATLQVKQYVVNQQIKTAADEYFNNYSANLKDDLKTLNNQLKDLEAELGTSSDAKDKKWKDYTGAEQGLTLYAALAKAKDDLSKAKTAKKTAEDNKTNLPADVKKAYEAMWDVYDRTSSTDKDKATAMLAFAKAVEAAWGTSAYNHLPATIDLSLKADQDEVVNYLMGSAGHDFDGDTMDPTVPSWNTIADVKALMSNVSTLLVGTAFVAPGAFDIDDLDTYFEGVTGVVGTTRKSGTSIDLVDEFNKAADKLGAEDDDETATQTYAPTKRTAYGEVVYCTKEIEGYFDTDHKLTANGQVQEIAAKKDDIAKKENEIATSEETVAEYKAAVEGADVAAYDAAAADVAEAVDAYNEAAAAVQDLIDEIDDMGNEQAALKAVLANDLEAQIKAAKDDLANLEKQKANWNNGITGTGTGTTFDDPDAIIAAAEADLVDAQVRLVSAAADLAAAQSALEALVGELDFDFDDEPAEEPSEEPAEEPSEEPAEGGEETPAEGEGEAEGGEEA